ncbi:phosphonate C-P lyase system protein PhnH [Peribacillus castrilensis]|uniref:Phosphonate C-P lyase system protein PhnH n=1 Tax=Peribacillus simplex TaxID=1478 RepID=A0AAN2PKP1_9BACI|nr:MULTISPECIES: phosphonate C-P lyase system protein PhnH [Bacillaceae]MCP1093359.1 phosphonate C-P lyase system protein PhnH [Bacillaceae bacterium OS4b]MBD8586222.1 phosphonate C-P lyase system protein PhnH [Peribacillus simplex]MCF7623970.1 phosphonate C-P lyase system protein PhnH [Peribacillus frigoritolerans]MCP1154517.1 phosphonate C-P lyase system protein PhnH [Peribacillus frigoritolerans]MCT1387527.1 phosphonate C-P lyase system protein PhnH [Peribacillus frigoritolerans]
MNLDVVHDIQTVYRKLVTATSRPGTLVVLDREARTLDVQMECLSSTILLARTVLDPEVSFKVISKAEEAVSRMINQLTYSKPVDLPEADFIFILHDASEEQMKEALNKAKVGNLLNPHESAMIILEVPDVTKGDSMILSGPGIQDESFLSLPNVSAWLAARNEKNMEFPLGIDMYFVDQQDRLIALPRTTQIRENGGGILWDMLQ